MDKGTGENLSNSTQVNSDPKIVRKQRMIVAGIVVVGIIILGLLVIGLFFLLNPNLTTNDIVARLRDIFIILMALESLLIGLALFILIIQIARLTNLLENEVKPILDSTNETISNFRGTTKFLSDNLVEPVIKLNEMIAVFQRVTDILHITKKR
jgi:uncharacterized integral membrane protein